MPLVLVHKEYGVFIGHYLGLAFFSNHDEAGQSTATTFECEEHIEQMVEEFYNATESDTWNIHNFTIHEVENGHYSTLKKHGIDCGFMGATHVYDSNVTH